MRAFMAVATLVTGLSTAAHAQGVRDAVTVSQGLQTVLQFTDPFSAASIGNPEIADAIPRSDRIIVIQGKTPGVTDLLTFYDGKAARHIIVTVQPATAAGKVITHNKKNLTEYTAYSCTSGNCSRMKDDFEGKDVILFGPGGVPIGVSTTGGITPGAGQPNYAPR